MALAHGLRSPRTMEHPCTRESASPELPWLWLMDLHSKEFVVVHIPKGHLGCRSGIPRTEEPDSKRLPCLVHSLRSPRTVEHSVPECSPQARFLLFEYDWEMPNCRTHSPSDGIVGKALIIEEQGGELGDRQVLGTD